MAYVNPYQDTMEYEPSTLWKRPKRKKFDWSTFWGKAEEDEEETTEEIRGDRDDTKEQDKLQSLWGDIVKDFETEALFKNVYSDQGTKTGENTFLTSMINQAQPTGIWASPERRQQYGYDTSGMTTLAPGETTQGWTNPLGPGVNTQVQQVGDTQATPAEIAAFNTQQQGYMNNLFGTQAQAETTGIPTPDTQGTALSYQPSYNQQQQDLIDQSTQAYQQSYQNQPDTQATQAEIDAFNAQQQAYANNEFVVPGGLTPNQSALSYANAPTVTYGNTGATNPTLGEILNGYTDPETGEEIDFDAVTDDERDWGDFW